MGNVIKQVKNEKHLGNLIGDSVDKQLIDNVISDIIIRSNEMIHLFSECTGYSSLNSLYHSCTM